MTETVAKLFRVVTGVDTGHSCRVCGEVIRRDDPFGRSERVCRSCR